MDKKKLPIGIDDFSELIQDDYFYIDKTLLIKEIISDGAKVILLTRPRRFGKTLNMSMVKEFFSIEKDSKGLFKGLKIMNTQYSSYINKYPVIFFSFRDCKGQKEELLSLLKTEIFKEYKKYQFLREKLDSFDKKYFDMVTDELTNFDNNDFIKFNKSIEFLCRIVSEYYKVNPVLLIDEYDTPMMSAYEYNYYEDVRSFFTVLYGSALKGNVYLQKALLTGIQRVAKENIFSGLNNLAVATVINPLYKEYFGLNEAEVIHLLKYYGIELTEDIKAMYNGYNFAGLEIYNPWSILNYARQRQLISYWVNTSTNALIRKTILNADKFFYESFDKLILNRSVSINARLDTSFFEMKNVDTLWGLLINAGYITITGEPDYENDRYTIKLPNKEVKKEFQAIVSSYININESSLKNMFYYLLNKDIDEFSKIYKGIVEQVTSYYDAKENAYHMLMLGMCIYLDSYYDIKSNIEAGDGRCDIMLTALNDKFINILIEFKQGDDVKLLAKTALNQIHSKKYYGNLQGDTLLLGIAHNKNHVYIEHELLSNNSYKQSSWHKMEF